ncbi:hypothetical protein BDF21DRAFT_411786 [Thamnidium elegans]|uniref:Uncharacterized protein n=1 Tax=Thamnidium elegans TaxID=101142 RepID=A0A8H7SKZ7_9FUNG|nr:hypothetical protein INT48_003662 [Thamnidium elegans]KAI8090670.1 hypothetical protein BDF21DRAFT_411786 [Thamnidium elegans]
MDDNSDIPITVSEVPPQKQSSALSFFTRLRRLSQSESSSSQQLRNTKSSPPRTFTQTPLESWIEQSPSYRSDSPEDSLPPWATLRESSQQDASFSIDSLPSDIVEEDSTNLIPEGLDHFNEHDEFSVLDSQDNIYPSDDPDNTSELYCTPRPHSSPEVYSPEPLPEEPYSFFDNNKNAGQYENDDNESQATVAYNPDDPDNSRENSPFSQTYSDELLDLLDNPELLDLLDNSHQQNTSSRSYTNSTEQISDNCAQSPPLTSNNILLRENSIALSESRSPVKQTSFSITSAGSPTAEEISFERKRKSNPKTIEKYFLPSSQDEDQLDIGRVSTTPSFIYNDDEDDLKKEDTQITGTDRRRRPKFGLSKK